jgi:uncharacterized OsmC-like protein
VGKLELGHHGGMANAVAFEVVVSAGSLRPEGDANVVMAHRWTPGGVVVDAEFTGAHLLHLATAGCVLNDLYREAIDLGIALDGVKVRASGDFDADTWTSTGIAYQVELAVDSDRVSIDRLLQRVDDVAEIPRALRAGTTVIRQER